jgi:hypothetical protein
MPTMTDETKTFRAALDEAHAAFVAVLDRIEPSHQKLNARNSLDTARLWALDGAAQPAADAMFANAALHVEDRPRMDFSDYKPAV